MTVPDTKALAPELVALVHHVELNKAGWWDIAVQKLVLTAFHVHSSDHLTLTIPEICATLQGRYSVELESSVIKDQLDILIASGDVFQPLPEHFKAAEKALKACASEIADALSLEASVRNRFNQLLLEHCPAVKPELAWSSFIDRFLVPLVNQLGANTYHLLTGSQTFEQLPQIEEFVACFEPALAAGLNQFLKYFLDPKDAALRRFVLRTMTGSFVVRAGGLNKATVDRLAQSAEKFTATLFCDSNVLFSLLGLHENPADDSSRMLLKLIHRLSEAMPISLRVLPPTLDEMKRALKASQEAVIDMRISPSLLQPAINAGLKGITVKYLALAAERKGTVAPADYFEPYLRNLVTILRDNGVELFNADLSPYKMRQDVIDELLIRMDFEKQRYGPTAKNYERLEHDISMWHFVSDKRPPRPDSPIDAKYWIVTADYRFLGYDAFKQRGMSSEIPICLHPIAVIQLLQFWVPMDSELETALFSAIRLPTVLAPFDGDAEAVSLQILNALSTFSNISDMPPETTTRILLNDALRQKLSLEKEVTRQIELVREALVEENRKADERVRTEVAKNRQIEQQSKQLESQLSNSLQNVEILKSDLAQALQREKVAKESERAALEREQAAAEDIQRTSERLLQKEREIEHLRRRNHRLLFALPYCATLAAIVGATVYFHGRFMSHPMVGSLCEGAGLLIWATGFTWLGSRIVAVKEWPLFERVQKAKLWLLLAIIGGVVGNAAWALLGKAATNDVHSIKRAHSAVVPGSKSFRNP